MLLELFHSLSHVFYMALHVVNSGSFPKPLSAEEERDCLEAFRNQGDLEARNRLVEHNLRLVAHIIKKYYSSVRDQDDLISIGTIGLMKAVSTFDYSKGIRLATYASRCIENAIPSQRLFWKQFGRLCRAMRILHPMIIYLKIPIKKPRGTIGPGQKKQTIDKIPPDVGKKIHQGVLLWGNGITRMYRNCCQRSRRWSEKGKRSGK